MGKPKNTKSASQAQSSQPEVKADKAKVEKEYKDNSFKSGLRHTGENALETGAAVVVERPALKIMLKSDEPSLAELQQWVDRFAALDKDARDKVLDLACHQKAASHGALAKLVGSRGENVQEMLKMPEGMAFDDVWKLLLVVESNSIEMEMKGGMYLSMLSLGVSHLKHSCSPNALLGLGQTAGTIELRALKPIAPGDEVTVSYLAENELLDPTTERREHLKQRWQFRCVCDRCAAPDMLRAFKCPTVKCKGLLYANSAGDGMEACLSCGRTLVIQQTEEFFKAEKNVLKHHAELNEEMMKAAGSLSVAVDTRDSDAFNSASTVAVSTLSKCAHNTTSNTQVDPSHHAIAGLASAAASVRTMLGDSFAAAGCEEKARKMWVPAAGGLREAMDAHNRSLSVPRDGYAQDLAGLAALYGRLGKAKDAKKCFEEARGILDLVSWACAPVRREELDLLRRGCEAALAQDAQDALDAK